MHCTGPCLGNQKEQCSYYMQGSIETYTLPRTHAHTHTHTHTHTHAHTQRTRSRRGGVNRVMHTHILYIMHPTHREADRQTDRQTDIRTDRQIELRTDRQDGNR